LYPNINNQLRYQRKRQQTTSAQISMQNNTFQSNSVLQTDSYPSYIPQGNIQTNSESIQKETDIYAFLKEFNEKD
jgi:hypothetical protein